MTRGLGPEGLDPARLLLGAVVSGAQRRKDLIGIHQVDVRRIGLNPERLRARRLYLPEVRTDGVRDAGQERRLEAVVERYD